MGAVADVFTIGTMLFEMLSGRIGWDAHARAAAHACAAPDVRCSTN